MTHFINDIANWSDEIRAKNKREDRLLDIRLKYFEREKKIRLNILRKETQLLERKRSELTEQWTKIQENRPKQSLASFLTEQMDLERMVLQGSAPELFDSDWEESKSTIVSRPLEQLKKSSTLLVRPHSAG